MSTKSTPKKSEKPLQKSCRSLFEAPVEIRAFVSTLFTAFFMFVFAMIGYAWGFVHGQQQMLSVFTSSPMNLSSQVTASTTLSHGISDQENDGLFDRSGVITALEPNRIFVQFTDETTPFCATTTIDTDYISSDENNSTTSVLQRSDLQIGDYIKIYATIDLYANSSFVATQINKIF